MKFIKLFSNHSEYLQESDNLPDVCIVYDKEDLHYISDAELTSKTYRMSAILNAQDGQEITILNSNN